MYVNPKGRVLATVLDDRKVFETLSRVTLVSLIISLPSENFEVILLLFFAGGRISNAPSQ